MTGFTGSPNYTRGAIIAMDPANPLASVIVFQYNPASLTRTLTPQMSGDGGSRAEAMRLSGPPAEEISLDVEIDATDQLEQGEVVATTLGIYPQLSALEMLIYPKSLTVIANTVLLAVGTIEIIPVEAPLTFFIWGSKRILPVRLTKLTITEQAHDVNLNPIRAKASLGLKVLSYNDLSITNPGYGVFLAHQIVKETMAVVGSASNLGELGSVI